MQCILNQVTLHIRPHLTLLVNIDAALMKVSVFRKETLDRSVVGLQPQDFTHAMCHYLHNTAEPLLGYILSSNSGLDSNFLMVMICSTKCKPPFQTWIPSLVDTKSCYVLFSEENNRPVLQVYLIILFSRLMSKS